MTNPPPSLFHLNSENKQQKIFSHESPSNPKRLISLEERWRIQNTSDKVEKHPLLTSFNELNNSNHIPQTHPIYQQHLQREINSEIHISKSRINYYLEYLWKIDIPKHKIFKNYYEIKTIKCRRDKEFLAAFIYVYYPSTLCGSSIFAFQTNQGMPLENFRTLIQQLLHELIKDNECKKQDENFISNNKNNNYNNNSNSNSNTISNLVSSNKSSSYSSSTYSYQNNNSSNCNETSNSQQTESSNTIKNTQDSNGRDEDNTLPDVNNNTIFINRMIQKNPSLFYSTSTQNEIDSNNYNNYIQQNEPSYDIQINFFLPSKQYSFSQNKNVSNDKIILSELNLPTSIYQGAQFLTFIIIQRMTQNSSSVIDYNGLINEGMTCYMNSMIQSYNVLGYFKRGIFSIPYDPKDKYSLSYSLQRLFYDLSFEKEPASTNQLIQSLGWSRDEIFIQHDVQEFNLMLSDLMEKKMKGTKNDEVFKFLFEGKISNEIICVDYEYKSIKEEKFNDIQLNVKGCDNIYDNFKKFTEEEILDGDDKYLVEGHGKEKAKKQISFISLPPVLILQLKRFEYNPKNEQIEKLNDYYKYEEEINMKNSLKKIKKIKRKILTMNINYYP